MTCPQETPPDTNFERFRTKAAAYLKQHQDHMALQRLRRNKQFTPDDLAALEEMLVAYGGQSGDVDWVTAQTGGLGLFSARWSALTVLPLPQRQ